MNDNQGGLWIPDIWMRDEPKAGAFWGCVRWLGWYLIEAGAWLKQTGYYQIETHPREALLRLMKEAKHD